MISLVKNNFICEKLTTQKIKKINKLKKTTKITNNITSRQVALTEGSLQRRVGIQLERFVAGQRHHLR